MIGMQWVVSLEIHKKTGTSFAANDVPVGEEVAFPALGGVGDHIRVWKPAYLRVF